MTTLHLRKSIDRSPLRLGFLLIPLALAWFALSSTARAADGSLPGGNTAEGTHALFNNTTGADNVANGFHALLSNSTGSNNTANGFEALLFNADGNNNTASGFEALLHTTVDNNTAYGAWALFSNTTGTENTAAGLGALFNNTTAADNTANGFEALVSNTEGVDNTAIGDVALASNTTGDANTAVGAFALNHNTGNGNIALGSEAGELLTTGDENIDIGNGGVAGEAGTIRIGHSDQTKTFIAGIRGVTTTAVDAVPVLISSTGQLGTTSSSRRFKKEIKPMDQTSEAILGLKPVTFHYKSDTKGTPQFGLIAEEVAAVNPDLVVRDEKGEIYTVRYEAVNAMLLNEFLKEHRTVQEQQATITQVKSSAAKQEATITQLKSTVAQQQKGMEVLTATLKEQASQIQKVSAQVEVSKAAPRTVLNNQ